MLNDAIARLIGNQALQILGLQSQLEAVSNQLTEAQAKLAELTPAPAPAQPTEAAQ